MVKDKQDGEVVNLLVKQPVARSVILSYFMGSLSVMVAYNQQQEEEIVKHLETNMHEKIMVV
jgi:hypothetical protein